MRAEIKTNADNSRIKWRICQQKVPKYQKMNFKILEAGGLELPNYKRYISLNIVYNVLGLSKVSEIRRTWPNVEQSKIQANVLMAVALQQKLTK